MDFLSLYYVTHSYAIAAYPNEKDMGKRDQRLKKRMTEHEKSF